MKKFLIILLIISMTACQEKKTVAPKNISNEAVNNISMDDKIKHTYILDVRSKEEYESGHIKNSLNIPLSEIANITFPKDSKIIVYCRSGTRSSKATSTLIELGYQKVYDMGGLDNWEYELEKED